MHGSRIFVSKKNGKLNEINRFTPIEPAPESMNAIDAINAATPLPLLAFGSIGMKLSSEHCCNFNEVVLGA